MRQRVAQFKEFTDSERAKLQVCWKQWNEIDKAIGVLGHGVLGNILLREPDDHQVAGGMTFRKAMELTDIEYSTTLDECNEEIDELGADLIVKLRNAEEVCFVIQRVALTDATSLEVESQRLEATSEAHVLIWQNEFKIQANIEDIKMCHRH